MLKEQEFEFKKARIEKIIQDEFDKRFSRPAKISARQKQKFIDQMTQRVSKQFGKEVLCLLGFNKQGLATWVLPARTESTNKGKLFQSFSHTDLFYTSHCLDRFAERMEEEKNLILSLDSLATEALVTYGQHDGYLICSEGVFAFEEEKGRIIIKTFVGYDLLDESQIQKFYSLGGLSHLPPAMISKDGFGGDIILSDELPATKEASSGS